MGTTWGLFRHYASVSKADLKVRLYDGDGEGVEAGLQTRLTGGSRHALRDHAKGCKGPPCAGRQFDKIVPRRKRGECHLG